MNNDLIAVIDDIEEATIVSEMEVCSSLIEAYAKSAIILENCDDDTDLSAFDIFTEGALKSVGKAIKGIFTFIVRLVISILLIVVKIAAVVLIIVTAPISVPLLAKAGARKLNKEVRNATETININFDPDFVNDFVSYFQRFSSLILEVIDTSEVEVNTADGKKKKVPVKNTSNSIGYALYLMSTTKQVDAAGEIKKLREILRDFDKDAYKETKTTRTHANNLMKSIKSESNKLSKNIKRLQKIANKTNKEEENGNASTDKSFSDFCDLMTQWSQKLTDFNKKLKETSKEIKTAEATGNVFFDDDILFSSDPGKAFKNASTGDVTTGPSEHISADKLDIV